jgi:hypothetical protein
VFAEIFIDSDREEASERAAAFLDTPGTVVYSDASATDGQTGAAAPPTLGKTTHETSRIPVDESRNDRIQDFARVRLKRNHLLWLGGLVSAKRVVAEIGVTQWLGELSDAALQRLLRIRGVAGRRDVGNVTHQSGDSCGV